MTKSFEITAENFIHDLNALLRRYNVYLDVDPDELAVSVFPANDIDYEPRLGVLELDDENGTTMFGADAGYWSEHAIDTRNSRDAENTGEDE
jgi:hypothetical protein